MKTFKEFISEQPTPQRSRLPLNNPRSGSADLKTRRGSYAAAGGLINIAPIEPLDSDSIVNSARRTAERKFQYRQIPAA